MSRAFLKDDAVEDPVMVPARAPLPPGAINYVTPRGLRLLHEERAELEQERTRLETLPADSNDRKRQLAFVGGRLSGLNARIAAARVLEGAAQPQDEVRFGAKVVLRSAKNAERGFQIVGVDEADAAQGRIAFTAPVARQLVGKRVGDAITLPATRGPEAWEIVEIAYE